MAEVVEPVRAEEIRAVPVRHPSRWIAAVVVLVLMATVAKRSPATHASSGA